MRRRFMAAFSVALATSSTIFIALGVVLAIVRYAPISSAYVVVSPEEHSATWVGNLLVVFRVFKVTRPTTLIIHREFTSVLDEALTRIELPATETFYAPGEYKTRRVHDLPDLLPGKYVLRNRVCWIATPLRNDCVSLPPLDVIFPPGAKE